MQRLEGLDNPATYVRISQWMKGGEVMPWYAEIRVCFEQVESEDNSISSFYCIPLSLSATRKYLKVLFDKTRAARHVARQ